MYRNLLVPLCALIAVLAVLSVPASAARSAPAAVADPCAQLQPGDLRYDAPDLVAVVSAQQGSCFALPDPAGTVYQLERIGTDEVVFLDAEGLPACLPSPENTGRCELDGRAPFRMDVPAQPYRGAPVQLRFAVFRLTGDTGCPRLPVSAYGRAREASFTGLDGGWLCLDLPASPTRVPLLSQAAAPFVPPLGMELLDDEGLAACPQRLCALPDGGSLLAGTTAARYTVSLVDLASDEGCSATRPDMRWTGRPLRASLGSATEFDCVLTDLEAGDSPLAETMTSDGTPRGVGLQIVDADGNQTCVPVGPCQGSGPYRLLVGGVRPSTGPFREVDYRAVVRLLSEEAGCARISPRPFGTAADDRAPGSGCRVFTALSDHRYEVDVVEVATGQKTSGSLLGADGQDGCVGSLAVGCTPRRTGDLFVVHSLFGGDVVTGVHDLSDELGCRPQDLGTPAVLEARLGPGQRDCVIVDGTTGQGLISPLGEDHVEITLVASDGIEISCLTCVGPERLPVKAVLGRGDAQQATVLVPGDWRRRACAALGEAPSARAVQLTRTRRLGCLRLPFATDEPDALHVRRVAGTGSPATTLVAADRGVACLGSGPQFSYQALGSWTCDANDPGGAFDVLLLGDGGDQRVVVSRTPAFEPERPIAGLTQPRAQRAPWLPSRAVVGRALRAGTGRWTPAPRTYAYQWLVAGRPVKGATRRTFVPRPQHVGRRVQVRVTARAPGLFDGAALSRSVVVRRGR